jgi:hypothetical protein
MLVQLLHRVSGQPVAVYIATLIVAAIVAVKHKVISLAAKKIKESVENRLWGYVRGKVAPGVRNYDKTYKGTFQGFFQFSSYPHEWFFTLLNNGMETKVPCMKSNLFSGIQHGAFVEIDTQVLPGAKVEVVRRVRKQVTPIK